MRCGRYMKIAFAGSHGAGKTTLLNDLKPFLAPKGFSYVTEVARHIIQRGYPLNMDANVDSYIHYINDQLNAEKAMSNGSIFISDRTLLDPLAYALVNRELPRPYIPDYFIEMMENVWLLEKERYDIYIYFPIEFPMQIDNVRPDDEAYRRIVGDKMVELLAKHNVPYVIVSGTPKARIHHLLTMIEQYGSK